MSSNRKFISNGKEPKYVWGKYFQKSLNYLFPLLGIENDEVFKPAGTYLWWNGRESIDDGKIIVAYEVSDPKVFGPFEKRCILKNPYFEKCYTVNEGMVYIFDLSPFAETVKHFMEGRYSKFHETVKRRILTYHKIPVTDNEPRPGRYIHMSLYPQLYLKQVEAELQLRESLRDVGELTNKYDRRKETLDVEIFSECEEEPKHKKPISSQK